jgi:uncharacterized membrane protein
VSNIARVWLVGVPQLVLRLHRYLLLTPMQLVLAGGGCMALAASSDLANTFDSPRAGGPAIALLLFATLLLAFLLFVLACRRGVPASLRRRRHLLRWLIYPIVLWSFFTAYQTSSIVLHGIVTSLSAAAEPRYGSDDMYYNHYNAWLVLHGQNPYVGERLAAALRYFGTTAFTPLARGRFADVRHYPSQAALDAVIRGYLAHPGVIPVEVDPSTTHSYPAGAFLVNLPAVWAGLPSIAITQLLLLLLLLILICRAAPPLWQPLALVLLLSLADGSRQVAGGDFEIWPVALIAMAWIYRDRGWISAILVGGAGAIKQTAWLAAPFYIIWVCHTHGIREASKRTAISLGIFLVINLPWIVASLPQWLGSLLLPVRLPLLPDGSGVIGLSLVGILPLLPSWIYGLLEVALLLGALWWYWRNWEHYPFAGLVLPLLPLLGAWRSSERYFVLLPLLGVLAAALTLTARRRGETPVETGVTRRGVSTGAL